MASRNKRKLVALNKENWEEHPRSNLASNSNVPRSQEDYIIQVSEKIEGRVTKKLSQEFSRTENRILGALARLDDFLMNPLLQGHSWTTTETSRNVFSINQGTNEDDSQSDTHPEAGLLTSGREDRHDMATGVQREREREYTGAWHFENLFTFFSASESLLSRWSNKACEWMWQTTWWTHSPSSFGLAIMTLLLKRNRGFTWFLLARYVQLLASFFRQWRQKCVRKLLMVLETRDAHSILFKFPILFTCRR